MLQSKNLKNLMKEVENKLGVEAKEKIWNWINLRLSEHVKGMAFFVSPEKDLWVVYKFPCSVKTGAYVERDIHIEPFLQVLDELERYCTVVCDKRQAKIFTVFLGQIEDYSYIFGDTPRKTKSGGWSQKKNQAWVAEEVKKHLKNVAEQAYKFLQEQNFDRLILGGEQETIDELRKLMHPDLQKRMVGQFATEVFKSNQHFLDQSLKIEEKAERENEKKLVEKLNNDLQGNLAVAGLKEVLAAAMERDVRTLLIDSKLNAKGKRCSNCDFLGLSETTCPYCETETEDVSDVVDELVQKAFSHRARIEFVMNNQMLSGLGGVGAMLRF